MASLARRQAYAEDARIALEENLAARRQLCGRIEALDGPDALRELDEARAAWSRLSAVPDEHGAPLSKRFALACDSCAARHERRMRPLMQKCYRWRRTRPSDIPPAWQMKPRRSSQCP